ncbi:MAG TPA: glycosyltransferase family 4 protein [Solirubrobacteraceae bacterium]|nr:glycosyltransferase family 4 protein [Solirubrobacteraceae bacterium]
MATPHVPDVMGRWPAGSLRICFLTHYFPPERGAPQVRIAALAEALLTRGHRPVVHTGFPNYPAGAVLAPYRNRLVAEDRLAPGLPVVRSLVYPARNAGFARRIVNHAVFAASAVATQRRTGPVDVVVAETPPLFTAAAAVAYAARKRAPLVLNVADRWPASAVALGALTDPRAVAAAAAVESWCYRHAAAVVAPSRRLARALEDHPDTRRVVHVPPAVDVDRFAAPAPRRPDGGPLHVVYAGTIGMAQAVDTLVEAAVRAGPGVVRVTIAGDGADAPAIRRAVSARGATNVTLLGPVPPEEVPALYAGADAGVVLLHDAPLFEEALPSKTFEVMAAGRPVLLGARGEAAELVQEAGAGLVGPPRDARALAAAMVRLHCDRSLARSLGAAGRRHVERRHARAAAADAWERLLTEVTSAPATARARDPRRR